MRGIGRYATGGRTVVPYSGDMLRYGYGPEHVWFTNNVLPWQDLGPLTPEEMGTAGQGTAQPGITGGQSTTAGDVASGLITAGTGAVILDKLTGGAISGGIKDLLGITPTIPGLEIGEPWSSGIDPTGSTYGEVIDFPDDGIGPPVMPPGYSAGDFQGYQPVENILDDEVWAEINKPYDYDPWGIAEAYPGYSSTYQPPTTSVWDPGMWLPHDYDPFGIAEATGGQFGSTFDFAGSGSAPPGIDTSLDFGEGILSGSSSEEEVAGGILDDWLSGGEGPGFFDRAGNWVSENLIAGPQEAETLWGMDVNNPIADKLAGAAAIYGAVQNPNPSTILQGAGGAASLLGYLPGFGTAYGLFQGAIALHDLLTGGPSKHPIGTFSYGIDASGQPQYLGTGAGTAYGGDQYEGIARAVGDVVMTRVMEKAAEAGVTLPPLTSDTGAGHIGFSMSEKKGPGKVGVSVVVPHPSEYLGAGETAYHDFSDAAPEWIDINDPGSIESAADWLFGTLMNDTAWRTYTPGGSSQPMYEGHAAGGPIMGGAYVPGRDPGMAHAGPVKGPGGGQDDPIPALLSDGEHIIDADTVSMLGDGSNDEGHRKLEMMKRSIRSHKRSAPAGKIPPKAKGIGAYLGGARA